MSIYVGDRKYDLHHTTQGDKVNRSVFVGFDKVWPLYEFSFYDGSMQKVEEGVPAVGKESSVTMRTCEDSWWHKLKYDEVYIFDQQQHYNWLRYNATKLQCDNNKFHWLSVTSAGSSVTPNSDTIQTISFSDNYMSFNNGTCSESSADTTMHYKIDKNEWFIERSGSMYGIQYDEWGHLSETMSDGYWHGFSPSDNNPTIFVTQNANEWGSNSQQIEFSCDPTITDVNGGTVTLKWKIYSNSTSGTTIYYGSNIASNNKNVDGDEEYAEGKMWIIVSNPNIKLNNDVQRSIKSNGVVEWKMTATWSNNGAHGDNCSHDISFSGLPSSVSSEGETFTVSATCTQTSQPRKNEFTLRIANKNNWRADTRTCSCEQRGETISVSCCVSDTGNFSPCQTSITITVDSIEGDVPDPEYTLYTDKSSVGDAEDEFIITSYYTQGGASGGGGTVWAQCPDGGPTVSASYSQDSVSSSGGFLNCTVSCNGNENITTEYIGNNQIRVKVPPHSELGDKDAIITVTQDQSGKTVTVLHTAGAAVDISYQYMVIITESATGDIGTSSVSSASDSTSLTMYARLYEKCTAVSEGAIIPDKSYDYTALTDTGGTSSGVTLHDLSFSFSGGNGVDGTSKWTSGSASVSNNAVALTISGSTNNETSTGTSTTTLRMESDPVSTIVACDANEQAFIFDFSVTKTESSGGFTRTGTFIASYSSASANCNWEQLSSVSSSVGSSSGVEGLTKSDFTCLVSDSNNFDFTSISGGSEGKYIATVNTKTAFKADKNGNKTYGEERTMEVASDSTASPYNVDDNSLITGPTFKVTVYRPLIYNTIGSISSRSVSASVEYSGQTISTTSKTQNVCPLVDGTEEDPTASISWSASESNDTLYSGYNPTTGNQTTVTIASAKATTEKTITFTAALTNNAEIKQSFDVKWPPGGAPIEEWTYKVISNVSVKSGCEDVSGIKIVVKVDNIEKINVSVGTIKGGESNTTSEGSAVTSAASINATIILYRDNTTEIDSWSYTFTKTNNTYTVTKEISCTKPEPSEIEIGGVETGNSIYICPGISYDLSFTIKDTNGAYVDATSSATVTSSDEAIFTVGTKRYSENTNIVSLTNGINNGTQIGGKSSIITITVGSVSKSVTIYTKDTYSTIFKEGSRRVDYEISSGEKSGTLEFIVQRNGVETSISSLPSGMVLEAQYSPTTPAISGVSGTVTSNTINYSLIVPTVEGKSDISVLIKKSATESLDPCQIILIDNAQIYYNKPNEPTPTPEGGIFVGGFTLSQCCDTTVEVGSVKWSDDKNHSDKITLSVTDSTNWELSCSWDETSKKNIIKSTCKYKCSPASNGGKSTIATAKIGSNEYSGTISSYDIWELESKNSTLDSVNKNEMIYTVQVKKNGSAATLDSANYGSGNPTLTGSSIPGATGPTTEHTTNGVYNVKYVCGTNVNCNIDVTISLGNIPYDCCNSSSVSYKVTTNRYECGAIESVTK
ncbi:MAG: hypothetical protein J6D03_01190 [Clostridia bacterium]|nr:hypothetical protein [Clostridia bacterium]